MRPLVFALAFITGCAEAATEEDTCQVCIDAAFGPDAPTWDLARADTVTTNDAPAPTDLGGPDAATDAPADAAIADARDVFNEPDRVAPQDVVIAQDVVDVVAPVDVPVVRDVVVVPRDVPRDTGTAPTGGCVSGAAGTHVARVRWTGTTSGSRASVSYEANTLPDRARWRVTANSRSIGYTPVWGDPFLGEGGLELTGTSFIDVELSTAGLGSIRSVRLALYGRSYNTTASGSFQWMTFDGAGASPSGGVANSAPYRWYGADATSAFRPGNAGALLRITAGPPSGSLVVNRIELCFDAN